MDKKKLDERIKELNESAKKLGEEISRFRMIADEKSNELHKIVGAHNELLRLKEELSK